MEIPMKSNRPLRSGLARILGTTAALLVAASFQPEKSRNRGGLKLALQRLSLSPARSSGKAHQPGRRSNANVALRADAPPFGHPIISGIGGLGFEESLRIDPANPNRVYTSAPGTASADTSWIWHSLDGGKTFEGGESFKWVVGATPWEGNVTTCHGGGDTEILVDDFSRLYFNDLTLANFSVARSDDLG